MKFARFLFLPALMTAFVGSAFGQAPMVDPAMSGMAASQGQPAMLGADCYPPMYAGQMAPGPVYTDCPPCTGPDPFGQPCQRTSRGYFSADAFLVHRKGSTPRTMATAAGVVQSSTADLDFGMETAPRLTFGYVLPNDVAIEGTAFYKDDLDALTDGVGAANLVSPYFAAVSAAGGVLLANSNYTGASVIHTDQSTGIHAYELNLVETGRKFNFISGFRYTELNDVLTVIATEGAAVSQSQISTSNYLLGGQRVFAYATIGNCSESRPAAKRGTCTTTPSRKPLYATTTIRKSLVMFSDPETMIRLPASCQPRSAIARCRISPLPAATNVTGLPKSHFPKINC